MTHMTADCIDVLSIRYTQQSLHPYFSNSRMSISETYVAVANGLLDPVSLSPIIVFEVNRNLYCIHTRRLKIMKELQRRNKRHVLKHIYIQYVRENDVEFMEQYRDLLDRRLPMMRKKGMDGSTISLESDSDYMCCFDQTGNFRDDLDKHIAEEHLTMSLRNFKHLNTYECRTCGRKAYIIANKRHSSYKFFQKCACLRSELWLLEKMGKPWTQVTFSEFCRQFLKFKRMLGRFNDIQRTAMELSAMKKQLIDQLADNPQQRRMASEGSVPSFGTLVFIASCLLAFFLITLSLIK